ncbi:MAG TPA: hypothetical protein GXX46_07875 [Peptococcaceae bacterium]|nr:hypothetical protein [Peptococcaceae bacterium]
MPEHSEQFLSTKRTIPKIKDSISLGLLSGLVGTLAMDLLNLVAWKRDKSDVLYGHLGASILMNDQRIRRRNNFLFGEVLHLITGALAGIPLVYTYKLSGKDQPIVKGAAFGSLVWFAFYVLGIKTHTFRSKPKTTASHKTSLLQNIFYGIVTAKTMTYLAHPDVFSQTGAQTRRQETDLPSKNAKSVQTWESPSPEIATEKTLH